MTAIRIFMIILFTVLFISPISVHSQSVETKSSTSLSDKDSLTISAALTPPLILDYQGFLRGTTGEPLGGSVTMTFSLWDAREGGSELWTETQTLDVRAGYFTAQMGSLSSLPKRLFNGQVLWLQLAISGETLSPRKRINSVAYSLYSGDAAALGGVESAAFYTREQANNHSSNQIDATRLGGNDASEYFTKQQTDARYMPKAGSSMITSDMIVDGTIQRRDLSFELSGGQGDITSIIAENGLEGGGESGDIRIGLSPLYQVGQAYDNRFIKRGAVNTISSAMIIDGGIISDDIQDGSIQQQDLAFTAGTINQVVAGDGLQGGGNMGSVTLSLRNDVKTGSIYDTRFVRRGEQNSLTSTMIRDNEITSVDIRDGSIQAEDMAFPPGNITAIQAVNGLQGGGRTGELVIGLEPRYQSGLVYDGRFINRDQSSSITSDMIIDGTITQEDMAFYAGDVTSVTSSGGIIGGDVEGDIHLRLDTAFQNGNAYDNVFVNENQSESVSSEMIVDGQIRSEDIAAGAIEGDHFSDTITINRTQTRGAIFAVDNQAFSTNTSGIEGRGYEGIRGIGTHTGLFGQGETYGVYAKASNNQGHALYVEGRAHCTTGGWGDVAEYMPSPETLEAGDVVVIDRDGNSTLIKCRQAYDSSVAGIISTAPTLTVGQQQNSAGNYPLALSGVVPCKVIADEPILPGDLLTTASYPGHAQKATNPQIGTILGKALEGLASGKGVIKVLVTLQ